MQLSRPKNLGISRSFGVRVSLFAVIVALAGMATVLMVYGVSDANTPILATILGLFGLIVPGLISSLKATETADTAAKTHNLVELTASQTAALTQVMTAHCGDLCPLPSCPLRARMEAIP